MRIINLKTDPKPFSASWNGRKPWEIRLNDRDYEVGDTLLLQETKWSGREMKDGKPLEYTGRVILVEVVHILAGPIYGLCDGWVIMTVSERDKRRRK